MRLGILPAAGKAERWGGYPKELLPISQGDTLLSRSLRSLQLCGCDNVLVVTNPSKSQLHAYHLRQCGSVLFAIQQGEELWGAISTAIQIPADEYYLVMPDTYVPMKPLPPILGESFTLGLFETTEPERFGAIREDRIVDKLPGEIPCLAWGTLAWKRAVADYWQTMGYSGHTEAINDAMSVFGYGTWSLEYYYDIGSMDRYRELLLTKISQDLPSDESRSLIGPPAIERELDRVSDR